MRKITFIIGAGASTDFGLPLGSQLANDISQLLAREIGQISDRPIIDSAMRSGLVGNFGEAVKDIAGATIGARSIDRVLHSRRDDDLAITVGKRAITAALSIAKSKTAIAQCDFRNWDSIRMAMLNSNSTWIARLFSILREGIKPVNANSIFSRFRFIVFNYDLCIEGYLLLAFHHMMQKTLAEAFDIVKQIEIVHIYGKLGDLPNPNVSNQLFNFDNEKIDVMASGIRTFTESWDEDTIFRARSLISSSDTLVFLGFAFDPLNVQALFEYPSDIYMCGTNYFVPEDDMRNFLDRVCLNGEGRQLFHHDKASDYVNSNEFRKIING